ncbi:MAG: hypothetical protein JWO36_7296 [Myxococcales bacterium]|nr:hypothetical protein [Myxococcales bacterium]
MSFNGNGYRWIPPSLGVRLGVAGLANPIGQRRISGELLQAIAPEMTVFVAESERAELEQEAEAAGALVAMPLRHLGEEVRRMALPKGRSGSGALVEEQLASGTLDKDDGHDDHNDEQ